MIQPTTYSITNTIIDEYKNQFEIITETSENEYKNKLQTISPIFTDEVIELLFKCFNEMNKNFYKKRLRLLEKIMMIGSHFSSNQIEEILELIDKYSK